MQESISIPKSLEYMIKASNEQLQSYQKQLLADIHDANMEIMRIMNLNPDDGWRLDIAKFMYIKIVSELPLESSPTPPEDLVDG